MELNALKPAEGSNKSARRLGRGFTRGKTCGRGHKGYKSRSGSSVPAAFEGGQMPLQRRLPKHGFSYVHSKREFSELTMARFMTVLNKIDSSSVEITIDLLKEMKVLKRYHTSCKILGPGEKLPKHIKALTLGKNVNATKSVKESFNIKEEA